MSFQQDNTYYGRLLRVLWEESAFGALQEKNAAISKEKTSDTNKTDYPEFSIACYQGHCDLKAEFNLLKPHKQSQSTLCSSEDSLVAAGLDYRLMTESKQEEIECGHNDAEMIATTLVFVKHIKKMLLDAIRDCGVGSANLGLNQTPQNLESLRTVIAQQLEESLLVGEKDREISRRWRDRLHELDSIIEGLREPVLKRKSPNIGQMMRALSLEGESSSPPKLDLKD